MTHSKNEKFYLNSSFSVLEIQDSLEKEYRNWAIKHGGFDKIPYKGKNQKVAIIDTGVDVNHIDLKDKVEEIDFLDPNIPKHLHGTFCSSLIIGKENSLGIIGIAPDSYCISYRVIYGGKQDGKINHADLISKAIVHAVHSGCHIISISLGNRIKNDQIEKSLKFAVDNGVIPFAAIGNNGKENKSIPLYPACYQDCIAVTSANQFNLPTPFSSIVNSEIPYEGPEIAIANIDYYWGCIPGNKYAKMNGTSMACPIAAGVGILWREKMENLKLLPNGRNVINLFRLWLIKVINDTNNNGWDPKLGFGVLLLEENEF